MYLQVRAVPIEYFQVRAVLIEYFHVRAVLIVYLQVRSVLDVYPLITSCPKYPNDLVPSIQTRCSMCRDALKLDSTCPKLSASSCPLPSTTQSSLCPDVYQMPKAAANSVYVPAFMCSVFSKIPKFHVPKFPKLSASSCPLPSTTQSSLCSDVYQMHKTAADSVSVPAFMCSVFSKIPKFHVPNLLVPKSLVPKINCDPLMLMVILQFQLM